MSETVVETAAVASSGGDAVTNPDIKLITGMLPELSPLHIKEAADFISFLAEKERRHKAFVEETLAAEMEPALTFNSAQEAFDAIFSET